VRHAGTGLAQIEAEGGGGERLEAVTERKRESVCVRDLLGGERTAQNEEERSGTTESARARASEREKERDSEREAATYSQSH